MSACFEHSIDLALAASATEVEKSSAAALNIIAEEIDNIVLFMAVLHRTEGTGNSSRVYSIDDAAGDQARHI